MVAMWSYIVQGVGYGLAATAQPGPFQTYVISQTLKRGWRRTLPFSLAPLVSDGPIIAVALLVLSQVPDSFRRALTIVSGFFILYLAWGVFRSWQTFDPEEVIDGEPVRQNLLKAAMMNTLSPGPYVYWSLVTGPILLSGWREAPAYGIAFVVAFYGALVVSLAGLIVVFGTVRRIGPKVNRALLGISAVALFAFGLYQLGTGIVG